MPSFATLDLIADCYIPGIAVVAIGCVMTAICRGEWRIITVRLAGLACVVLLAFGVMAVDEALAVWPRFGLDYSTHTALALGLVLFLVFSAPRFAQLWIYSLVAYLALMVYQRYHTLPDIVTTGAAVGVPLMLALILLQHQVTVAKQ